VPIVVVAVVVACATIAGLLLGGVLRTFVSRSVGSAAAAADIAEGGVLVELPGGWAPSEPADIPGFKRPVGLYNEDQDLRAAVERLPATSSTLLPAAFLHTLKRAPGSPAKVWLGSGHDAWRYRFPLDYGSQLILYAAPTTSGIATVACLATTKVGVPRGCESLASAVTVPGSRTLEPVASTAFLTRLPTAVTRLDAARTKGTQELSTATRASSQAAAAEGLAKAHERAAVALTPFTSKGDTLASAAVRALTATANAYAALASGARAREPRAYRDASRAVTGADADLRLRMTRVSAAARATSREATPTTSPPAAASGAPVVDISTALLTLIGAFVLVLAAVLLAARRPDGRSADTTAS
jgi:hypothetical protein